MLNRSKISQNSNVNITIQKTNILRKPKQLNGKLPILLLFALTLCFLQLMSKKINSTNFRSISNMENYEFILFMSNKVNDEYWCGDCEVFSKVLAQIQFDGKKLTEINVGTREEWNTEQNEYKLKYNIQSIPTIIEVKNGVLGDRLVENDCMDKGLLAWFLGARTRDDWIINVQKDQLDKVAQAKDIVYFKNGNDKTAIVKYAFTTSGANRLFIIDEKVDTPLLAKLKYDHSLEYLEKQEYDDIKLMKRFMNINKVVVHGAEEARKYLVNHKHGQLFLLYMSDKENEKYWCPDCEMAKDIVYNSFENAKKGSILLEIRVGNRDYWKNPENEFRTDSLFYVDNIPTIMRYDGNNRSSHFLSENSCRDQKLLDFVFQVPTDIQFNQNSIQQVDTYDEFVHILTSFKNEYPLFVQLVSGLMPGVGRPWCPYCEKSEITVNYYFNRTAPTNSKLLKVIVADTYEQWHNESNPYRNISFIKFDGIPVLLRYHQISPENKITKEQFTHYDDALLNPKEMIQFFNRKK